MRWSVRVASSTRSATFACRRYRVTRAIPRYPVGTSLIPSADGSEAYEFNASATLNGLTGRIVRTFTYDGEGRITAINETDYGTTQVAYTAAACLEQLAHDIAIAGRSSGC